MNQSSAKEFPSFFASRQSERVAVILAGGDGTRLKSLTRAITGDERPKQFCRIIDNETLLDKTRNRVALRISPDNTYFSLTKHHEGFYSGSLWDVPGQQMIVQPENKGTAPAILYSLMRIRRVRPAATVAFFPSDHYFSNDDAFMENVESAFQTAAIDSGSVVLLGMEPKKPEVSYGWIEPAKSLFGDLSRSVSRVERFWEKPAKSMAKKLMMRGCLWNSFVMVGKIDTFLNLFKRHLPELYRMFEVSLAPTEETDEAESMRSLYSRLSGINFSSQVLERAVDHLLVMRVGEVGWSDWGEPQRLIKTLAKLGIQPEWLNAAA